jgi:UDP-glucose 4-epimerase
MRSLVTGAAGYIGSAVCWKLLEHGHQVVALDNLKYGTSESVPPGVPIIRRDIANPHDQHAILFALESNKIEAVCHLAAESEIPVCQSDPLLAYRVNLTGGLMLLEAMRRAGVPRLIHSSTAAVYGHDQEMPLREDSRLAAESPYGASKLAFEQSLRWVPGLSWVAFRYFNVCGATEHAYERPIHRSRLISVALDCARGTRPHMTLNGQDFPTPDGTPLRDYVHVQDIAAAHLRALEQPSVQGVFNLGCDQWHSNLEVIDAVERATKRGVPYRVGPARDGDPPALRASNERAKLVLGWRPAYTSLDEMIESCWKWEPQA